MSKILVNSDKIIALSGGIASGKTFVLDIFENHGFFTVSADHVVQILYQMPYIIEKVSKIAPSAVVQGSVSTNNLRKLIIADSAILDELEKILLPEIKNFRDNIMQFSSGRTIVYEIPLLHETKQENQFDIVINLVCPKAIRLRRAQERGMDKQLFEIMDKRQVSNRLRRKYCNQNNGFVIDTSVSIKAVHKQIMEIIQLEKAKK